MNQVKTFFKIVDKFCLEALGKEVLNFWSSKGYDYFLNCKDNNKTWQSFEVLSHGTIKEMIKLYLFESKEQPSVLHFLQWTASTENNTLRTQLFMGFGLGIYIQRIDDRNNDVIIVSNAGRYKFFDLFFEFKHPIYREVEYHELRKKILYPDCVKNLLENNITVSTNETNSKCQGGDFMLEEKIKKQKGLAQKGVISSKTWQRISRSIDKVEDIVDNVKTKLGVSNLALAPNIFLEKEIVALRKKSLHSELFWSAFFPDFPTFGLNTISPYSVRMRENSRKMRTRITPNTDSFYAVLNGSLF